MCIRFYKNCFDQSEAFPWYGYGQKLITETINSKMIYNLKRFVNYDLEMITGHTNNSFTFRKNSKYKTCA